MIPERKDGFGPFPERNATCHFCGVTFNIAPHNKYQPEKALIPRHEVANGICQGSNYEVLFDSVPRGVGK